MAKVIIDQDGCISCGMCSTVCPEVFEMDEEGTAQVKTDHRDGNPEEGSVPDDITCIKDAEESCPVDVITVKD